MLALPEYAVRDEEVRGTVAKDGKRLMTDYTELDCVHCVDALELMKAQPPASIDAIIIDPPYGFGLDTWDNAVDIPSLLSEAYRVLKPDSFFVFFIQAPYDLDWRLALRDTPLQYVEHVAWLKRMTGSYSAGLCHAHESIYIYRKGKARFVEVKGLYTDVKVPGLMFDAISIDGIQRHISDLHLEIKSGKRVRILSSAGHKAHFSLGNRNGPADMAPEFSNFTNVWSFLPQNLSQITGLKFHASQKPVKLLERLLTLLTVPGATVLDCFVGSGTTAVACKSLDRRFICADLEAEFVEYSRRRTAQTVKRDVVEIGVQATLPMMEMMS